jgi:glycosyltransferase involved in cell wall biosynthesis
MDLETWAGLEACWRSEIGEFDGMAVYERVQAHRPGLALLLMRKDRPVAFVKLRRDGGEELRAEARALEALAKYGPTTFQVPALRSAGSFAGWHYVAVDPIPTKPHRAANRPPIQLIAREIDSALADLPRPPGTPDHWRPMHGDLTPWNLRQMPNQQIVLTDWEESGWGPPEADEVLYRATAAASRNEPAGVSSASEAIDFWERQIRERPTSDKRDRKLEESLAMTLASMRRPRSQQAAPATRKPRVLVIAYACEPGRGSEPGAGWGLVSAVAAFADCTVLVGPEHMPALRKWKAEHPDSSIRFVEVPEARLARTAKLHRLPWFLLYQRWLRTARGITQELHNEQAFDAMYHATYATYWLPTPAAEFGVPCVWGPVGGAVTTPVALWPALGTRGIVDELFDLVSVRLAALRRSTRRTWRGATTHIVQNAETLDQLPRPLRDRAHLLSHVNFVEMPPIEPRPRGSHVVWLSSLEARKGPRLVIHALAHTPADVRLQMIGDGPERPALERLARRLGVSERVAFLGQVPRAQALQLVSEAACAVFTNLREEGGVALAEAMLTGTATVVLANGGTRLTASTAPDPKRVRLIPAAGFHEAARQMARAMTEFSHNPPMSREPNLDQGAARDTLRRIFEDAMAQPAPNAKMLDATDASFATMPLNEGSSLS